MRVRDLMTRNVHALSPADTMLAAKQLIAERRIRHIPILSESGDFLGLVSQRDILSAGLSRFAEVDESIRQSIDSGLPLAEIMVVDVAVVSPEASVREAAKVLLENKFGCLPVLEGRRLVGILTESDFMKLVVELLEALEKMP